ncbi:MAG: DNRLRE domain-containing protein [Planctomycetota bacterium]
MNCLLGHIPRKAETAVLTVLLSLAPIACKSTKPQPKETQAAERPAEKTGGHQTDWFHEARWGVMFHFASAWLKLDDPDQWDKAIAAFDVEGLARQLNEVGAGYFLITVQHLYHPLAPNRLVKDGKFPSRDIIPDLADALAKYDIKLMLYYPTAMGMDRPKAAQRTAAIIEEYSRRYGKKVKGWWLDNNYPDTELQKLIADAARAGNRDAIIGFAGPKGQQRNSPYEDYSAGNSRAARQSRCYGRFIQGVQWHMLSHLGHSWCGSWKYKAEHGDYAPRFPADLAVAITTKAVRHGGVVTWDVPPLTSGLIHPAFIDHLKAIGKAVSQTKRVAYKVPQPPPRKTVKLPTPPENAITTTLAHVKCRTITASQHPSLDTGDGMLRTAVGTSFHHFLRAHLLFDLSKTDRSRPVHSAILHLYLRDVGTWAVAGSPVIVNRFTKEITDETKKWYHFPVAEAGQQKADAAHAGPLAIDVTQIVKAWLSGAPNYGFRLTPVGLGEDWLRFPYTIKDFEAGTYDATSNRRGPRLVIHQLPK